MMIKYTDEGENYLAHENPYPRQKGGLFGFAPYGSSRRYATRENKYKYRSDDGPRGFQMGPSGSEYTNNPSMLTDAGRKRWERDKRANALKKKENRVKDEEELIDPNRWAREDLESAKLITEGVGDVTRNAGSLASTFFKDPPRGRYDLSSMSDQELQSILRREQMERQYNDYFNPQQESKGRKFVETAVNVVTTTTAIAGGALGIALAIKKLNS